jgi:flagellar biosynthesis protein FlhF
LAKLAARAKLEHNRSVGIVTLDTYRVGAVEQWNRYSQLLRTPFAVARTREEFEATVQTSTCELLFVDTSGRTLGERKSEWLLPEFLARVSRYQVHALLVLPAWLRARDAERVAEAYSDTPATGAVVTKLDETMHRGGALQAIISKALPLAYTCDGPRVPEDIRDATLEAALSGLIAVDA